MPARFKQLEERAESSKSSTVNNNAESWEVASELSSEALTSNTGFSLIKFLIF